MRYLSHRRGLTLSGVPVTSVTFGLCVALQLQQSKGGNTKHPMSVSRFIATTKTVQKLGLERQKSRIRSTELTLPLFLYSSTWLSTARSGHQESPMGDSEFGLR